MTSNTETSPSLGKGRLLKGANVHHRTTVYVQPVVPGPWSADVPAVRSDEFREGFAKRFGEAARPDSSPCELLLQATSAMERMATRTLGRRDDPGMARITAGDGFVNLIWEAHTGWVSRDAARAAFSGMVELLGDDSQRPSFAEQVAELERRARRRMWSERTADLAWSARQRGIPHEVLAGNYVRLGEGVLQAVVAADASLDDVFPAGAPTRIPTALIVGDRGTRSLARALDKKLRAQREGVGLATHKRTTIQGEPIDPTTIGSRKGPEYLLGDPRVAVMIATHSPRRIARKGLRLDECSVAILLDPKPDGDDLAYRDALDVVLAATTGVVVIGADNPHVQAVASRRDPERLLLCGPEPEDRLNAIHLALIEAPTT